MPQTILIVDDDPDLVELLTCSFTQAGYLVLTENNGVRALDKARRTSPDLIVLDLVLPEMDGFTVCEILRRESRTARIPILMLTGLTSQLNRIVGLSAGATEYVMKPTTSEALLAKVEALLRDAPEAMRRPARPLGRSPQPKLMISR